MANGEMETAVATEAAPVVEAAPAAAVATEAAPKNINPLTNKPRKTSVETGAEAGLGDKTEFFQAQVGFAGKRAALLKYPELQKFFRLDDYPA